MDVYLKKRYDLIPNLVETVKHYAIHEKETLEKVINARTMAMGSQSIDERVQNENMLSGTLKSLFAVSESYPDLKADTSFLNLQNQLSSIENEISQARKILQWRYGSAQYQDRDVPVKYCRKYGRIQEISIL